MTLDRIGGHRLCEVVAGMVADLALRMKNRLQPAELDTAAFGNSTDTNAQQISFKADFLHLLHMGTLIQV